MTETGLVLRVDAKVCHVEVADTVHPLPLRGRMFEGAAARRQPVAVGDRVAVRFTEDGGVIEERLPRTSKLSRARRGAEGREHVLAANISLVVVTAAVVRPEFQPELVDRILAGAEAEKIEAVLVMTKIDRDRRDRRKPWVDLYRALGYRVFETSVEPETRTEESLAAVGALLRANVAVLCGASGVGKSSLINALCPGLDLRIGSMSRIMQGRHTTTHTQLIALPGGGHVLDTPGIRGFGLFFIDRQAVQFHFREIAPLVGRCDYRNCLHQVEPGCAVRAALEEGALAPSRYASYLALVDELSEPAGG